MHGESVGGDAAEGSYDAARRDRLLANVVASRAVAAPFWRRMVGAVGLGAVGLGALGLGALGCRHVTDPAPTAVGSPTASLAPRAIIEQYQSDPKLGDELFDGKMVHIDGFRVDEASGEFLWMREGGFELRIDRPDDRKKIYEGDTLGVYCEGDGINGTLIVFEGCRSHL